MQSRPASFLLSSLLLASHLVAQNPPRRDPQAVNALAQSYASMGPSSAAVQDSVVEATLVQGDGTTGSITIKTKGARLRYEVTLGGRPFTYVVSQGKGHMMYNGEKQALPLWTTMYQRAEHIPVFSRMADFGAVDTKIEYMGIEEVAGQPAHHIRLSAMPTEEIPADVMELISEFHVFVDAQTSLVVKTQGYLFSPEIIENRSPVETYYSDYRAVSGVLVPHRISRFISGRKDCDINITSVRFNVGVADSEFE